jgi:hypothetical protein
MRRLGTLASCVVLAATLMAPAAVAAATLAVDTFEDSFDGTCADDFSLRDAIASVDAAGTVRMPPGFYQLSLAGAGGIETGDLDVDRSITIEGAGELGAFIDASALDDRAFDLAASASLRGLTLIGGSEVGRGGIVRVATGTARIADTTLLGGVARNGGAVAVGEGAAVRIVRSWVSKSLASERGGALLVRGHATVERSTISEGQSGAGGGAWVGDTGSLEVSDSTISSSTATRGGGGLHIRGLATLRSTTVARDRATVGGAIFATPTADVTIGSSVLEGNAATGRAPTCSRPLSSDGHNVADGFGCGLDGPGDLTGVDPMLGSLRQNGGPTPTHALRIGSPAVGNGAACSALDQRGAPRSDCDGGAYELVFCLGRPVTIVGTAGRDDLSGGLGKDVFLGRAENDVFQGSLANDRACGGPGNDHLIAGPGDDRLAGEGDRDRLEGEDGDDLLLGGPAHDECLGGGGADRARGCERVTSAA